MRAHSIISRIAVAVIAACCWLQQPNIAVAQGLKNWEFVTPESPGRELWRQAAKLWLQPADPLQMRVASTAADDRLATGAVATLPDATSPQPARTSQQRQLIRHLPNTIQGYRLTGEIASSEWPIFLTEAQSRGRVRFQVGYLASISVMPEASVLSVWVNDKMIGRVRIFAALGVRVTEFSVPDGLLQYGFNSIRIGVEQRHRVDCSLAATYELWTQVDPSRTGLMLPGDDPGIDNLRDLAAVPVDAQGSLPIRAVIPGKAAPSNIENVTRAAQSIALAGRFEQPVVDYGAAADGPYGINLAIGTVSELAEQFDISRLGAVTGPRVVVLPAAADERTAVIVTGANSDDVRQALGQLLVEREQIGSAPGLRVVSNFPGFRLRDRHRVQLRDLGVSNAEFSGRFFRTSFNIMTPSDFYSADYGKVFLEIDGGYAPDLLPDSQIMININDQNAGSLQLPKSSGEVFRRNAIPLPLSLFRPGLNRIEIQAQVPTSADKNCDPLEAIDGKKRFLLLDTSELVFPSIARIARMPDLALTTSGGFPFNRPGATPKLFVPSPDKDTMGAATTMAARLAVAAGRPINFELALTAPAPGAGPVLAVAPAKAFSAQQIAAAGIDPSTLRAAWEQRSELPPAQSSVAGEIEAAARARVALQRNFPAACSMGYVPTTAAARSVALAAVAPTPQVPLPPAAGSRDLFDQWQRETQRGWLHDGAGRVRSYLTSWSDGTVGAVRRGIASFTKDPATTPAISAQSSLIVAQSMVGTQWQDVWTYILAPNAQTLGDSIDCLVDPRVWQQVRGRLAFVDASEGTVRNISADYPHFIPTRPLSPGNVRLIAAGWFSFNQIAYVMLAFVVSVVLSASTLWVIRGLGRRSS